MDCDSGRINFVDVDNNKLVRIITKFHLLFLYIFTFVDKFTQPVLAAMNPGYQGAQLQLRNGFSFSAYPLFYLQFKTIPYNSEIHARSGLPLPSTIPS